MKREGEPFSFGEGLRLRPETRRYAGIWVGVLTVLFVSAVFFCEMHLTAAPVEQTAMTAAVTVFACFVMYTSMFDAGRQRGLSEEKFLALTERYEALRDRAREQSGEGVEAFCTAYVAEELTRSRRRLLFAAGESEEDFLRYREGRMPREEYRTRSRCRRRALRAAARMKPLHLHAALLLTAHGGERRGLTLHTGGARLRRGMRALVPTVFGSLVTVAVTLEGQTLTLPVIIAGLFRIFTLIWTGVRGYTAGGASVTAEESTVMETKATLLGMYLAEVAKQPPVGDL